MPIEVSCTHCGKVMRVKDSMGGGVGLCPHCKGEVTVPFVASVASVDSFATDGIPDSIFGQTHQSPNYAESGPAAATVNPTVSPPPLSFECPHCRVRLSVPASQAGTAAACPTCQGRFQIPLPSAVTFGMGSSASSRTDRVYKDFVSKKIAAGICGLIVGGFGVHKFMTGRSGTGGIMLGMWFGGIILAFAILPIFATIAMNIIGFIEGILILTKSDEDFYQAYAVEQRQWF